MPTDSNVSFRILNSSRDSCGFVRHSKAMISEVGISEAHCNEYESCADEMPNIIVYV